MAYKPNKKKDKHFVKKMQETEGLNEGFGNYKESTGGGHPFEAGNSNTRTTQENGKIRKSENPKTNQPRTEDGKFTYKSANGKSIDPKYGPSRGKTVNPLLTGGKNGVYIRESTYDHNVYSNSGKLIHKKGEKIAASEHNVEDDFESKSGSYWDKYKDKWYNTGGKIITEGLSTQISARAVWEKAKEYNEGLGEFDQIINKQFSNKGEQPEWSTKFGKKSKTEAAAIEKAQKSGDQAYVMGEDGGIESYIKGGNKAVKDFIESKKPAPQPVSEKQPETSSVPASQPKQEPEKVKEDKPWGKTGTFTESQKDKFVEELKKYPDYDPDFFTDEFIEDFMLENKDKILNN